MFFKLRSKKSTKKSPTHTTHKVVVLEKETCKSWRGNLRLLASSLKPDSYDDCTQTDNASWVSFEDGNGIVYSDKNKGIFSFYQRGDGSEQDPDRIPQRYLDMADLDATKALEAVERTLEWREENGIDEMLNRPHTKFDIYKAVVPHYYIGRDISGHVVYVQSPAHLNMDQLKSNGLDIDDVLYHSIYVQEYLWQIVEAENPMATITNIIDAGGLSLSDMRKQKEQRELMMRMISTFDTHFPTRGHKTIIVNAPSWFNILFQMVKPLMRESTTALIEVCTNGSKQDATLLQQLGEETSKSLPDFCWSQPRELSQKKTEELPMEKDLRNFVMSRIRSHGQKMQRVLP